MKNYAVIDLGSLKVKLLIGSVAEDKVNVLKKESQLTCLGQGLEKSAHRINKKPLYDTIKVIKNYKLLCDKFNVSKIKVVATESLRCACNIKSTINIIRKETTFTPAIISREEEAKKFFNAVVKDFPENRTIAIVDMGGGSIQVLIGKKGKLNSLQSLPLGSYLLHQKFIKDNSEDGKATSEELEIIRSYINEKIYSLKISQNKQIPLIYGSSNVLDLFTFLKLKLEHSLLSPTHPFKTNPDELLRFLKKINNLSHKEREDKYPFQYGYMWGIQMAFYNAYYLAKLFHTDEIIPSNVNIAEGYLLEMKSEK
jgi:exopolyphosphatase/pppGpp-phosphohydrolase